MTCDFDFDEVGVANGNYFGFGFEPSDAALVLLSVPWDVTSSYGAGSSSAPDAIIGASVQLDFYDPVAENGWKCGVATLPVDYSIHEHSIRLREDAKKIISHLEEGGSITDEILRRKYERVNKASAELNRTIYRQASEWLVKNKIVGLVGGDHSTPLGLIRALGEKEGDFGILHLDAHRDLRAAYEGFNYSHASIMYNVLKEIPEVKYIVQVGIRDWSTSEQKIADKSGRVTAFDDFLLAEAEYDGSNWSEICDRIAEELPEKVYISFDIDVLAPENYRHTGTPVPGGISYNRVIKLLKTVAMKRRIIGFDLCEVTPSDNDEWDANVGARILLKLCNFSLKQ
jgi:agmatinase